jgi:hypothetical protein
MFEPLLLRNDPLPRTLVVIRLGSTTLSDEKLARQCLRTHARWGLHGFSVFEVPDGSYERLAKVAPIVTVRPKLFEANAGEVLDAGFSLFATQDYPHWTVVCPQPTPEQFAKVRAVFQGPVPNPAWSGRLQ